MLCDALKPGLAAVRLTLLFRVCALLILLPPCVGRDFLSVLRSTPPIAAPASARNSTAPDHPVCPKHNMYTHKALRRYGHNLRHKEDSCGPFVDPCSAACDLFVRARRSQQPIVLEVRAHGPSRQSNIQRSWDKEKRGPGLGVGETEPLRK